MSVDVYSPSKAEYLIKQLNVTNAKKIALLLVLCFIGYHGLIHLRYGMTPFRLINFNFIIIIFNFKECTELMSHNG